MRALLRAPVNPVPPSFSWRVRHSPGYSLGYANQEMLSRVRNSEKVSQLDPIVGFVRSPPIGYDIAGKEDVEKSCQKNQ
jgi:hypothetical protein